MNIQDVALLARLRLTASEEELFAKQLKNTIDYIDKLNELETAEVEQTAHILPIENVFREDEPTPSLSCEKALQNAPEREDNYFVVPRILE